MKITSWNINGIRSLKKSVSLVLQDFCSDVICFQETKISRSQLSEETALIDGYTSYFSYPRRQSGYSGVATYCADQFTAEGAEEELTLNNACSLEEIVDFEGRVMVTHHLIKQGGEMQRLSIVNVYCPRVDPEKPERHLYKLNFCQILQEKMHELCLLGNSVVIVGDLNIASSVIDHCDPGDEKEFNSSPARQWLKSFFSTEIEVNGRNIKAIDSFRYFYPDRKEAYTCWNTKIGARLTNYGTRIDYIIVSSDLIPLLSSCEILSDYQGSDHCPVTALLKCDPVPEHKVQLPAICTRMWPEFTGQQQKLNSFFQKVQSSGEWSSQISTKGKAAAGKNKQKTITSFFKNNSSQVPYARSTRHLTSGDEDSTECSTRFSNSGDKNLSVCSHLTSSDKDSSVCSHLISSNKDSSACSKRLTTSGDEDSSMCSGLELNVNTTKKNGDAFKNGRTCKKSDGWGLLLRGPPKPPLCDKHQKPCVLRTVKKSGANVGRQFYMCAQPVGAMSNPDSNCNFFKWVTAPKVNSLKSS